MKLYAATLLVAAAAAIKLRQEGGPECPEKPSSEKPEDIFAIFDVDGS